MAKQKDALTSNFIKNKKTNKGVHSKKKASVSKNSKNYKKLNVGQGK